MNRSTSYTYGNLALQMNPQRKAQDKPRFSVIEGNRATVVCLTGHKASQVKRSRAYVAAQPTPRVQPAPVAQPAPKPLTLYGILVSLALIMCFVTAVLSISGMKNAAYQQTVDGISYESVSVDAGEGLWQIAESHPVEGLTTQQVSDLISEHNGLATATLQPGQDLEVPAQS